MRIRRTYFPSVLVIFLLSLPWLEGRTAEEDQAVRLSLRIHKNQVLLGEPVFAASTLQNPARQAILIYDANLQKGHYLITRDGQFSRVWATGSGIIGTSEPRQLQPGGTITISTLLYWCVAVDDQGQMLDGGVQLAFPQPGNYSVQALYEDTARVRAVSAPVSITVHTPEGIDEKVWNRLRSLDTYGDLIHERRISDPNKLQPLLQIIREFPGSVYSQYLALGLGRHYLSQDVKHSALKYFRLASEMKQVPFVREEAMVRYAELLRDVGQREESLAVAREALDEFPDTEYKQRLEHLIGRQSQTEPRAVYDRAVAELKKQGYDVTGFGKIAPEEYNAANYDLWMKYDLGTISEVVFWRQKAEVLTRCVTKYTQPLPPEELQQRERQYKAEEEARRAEAYERLAPLRSYAEELLKKVRTGEITNDEYNRLLWERQMELKGITNAPNPFAPKPPPPAGR